MLSTALFDGQKGLETEIIVIGSLLDKLPNLAGLALQVKYSGLGTLYVPDLSALASTDFINVAMTAEKWLDIRQLAVKRHFQFPWNYQNWTRYKSVIFIIFSSSFFSRIHCCRVGTNFQFSLLGIIHLPKEDLYHFGQWAAKEFCWNFAFSGWLRGNSSIWSGSFIKCSR